MANDGNLGRENLKQWSMQIWDRLDAAVHDEMKRIRIARRFVPVVQMADALTAPADAVSTRRLEGRENGVLLRVDPVAVTPVIDIWVEFALTVEQVEKEATLSAAVTLATRATNLLMQGEDLLVNQGDPVIKKNELFTEGRIHTRAGPGPNGIATIGPHLPHPDEQVVEVKFTDAERGKYGESTFGAVELAYARLQRRGPLWPVLAGATD